MSLNTNIYHIFAAIGNIFLMTIKNISDSIRFRREFLNLRQEDLAEMSGVTIKTIHLIERGTGNPSMETLEKLGKVLGMELLFQVKMTN